MYKLFSDLPEAIDNISAVIDKIEVFDLKRSFYFQNLIYQISLLIIGIKVKTEKEEKTNT